MCRFRCDSFYICHEFLTMMRLRLPPLNNNKNNNNNCQLDDVMRCKHETEERNLRLTREKADLTSSLAENEEELQEVMRRYNNNNNDNNNNNR